MIYYFKYYRDWKAILYPNHVAQYYSILQYITVYYSILQYITAHYTLITACFVLIIHWLNLGCYRFIIGCYWFNSYSSVKAYPVSPTGCFLIILGYFCINSNKSWLNMMTAQPLPFIWNFPVIALVLSCHSNPTR